MSGLTLIDIKEALCATSQAFKNTTITGLSIDSRSLKPGDLFIAVKGVNFDGHDYTEHALNKGAVAVVVERPVNGLFLQVNCTMQALRQVAACYRQLFKGVCIALTGSTGKTTVKTLLSEVMLLKGSVLSTAGNLNNHIGVPLTLSRLNSTHQVAVVELGASAVGEIKETASLTKPDVALITNASEAHIEGFGSLESVIQTKGEIIDVLSDSGQVVLNRDDPAYDTWLKRAGTRSVISFGLSKEADVRAIDIQLKETGACFVLCYQKKQYKASMLWLGKHNIINYLASFSVGLSVGLPIEKMIRQLSLSQPIKGRLCPIMGAKGLRILDDSYNASPASVRAAIDLLVTLEGRTVLILGDMDEMGALSEEYHEKIGQYAKKMNVHCLLAVGQFSQKVINGFGYRGVAYKDQATLLANMHTYLHVNDWVLIKGSHRSSMSNVVNALQE